MKKRYKIVLYPILGITAFAGIGDFCQKRTKGFSVAKLLPASPSSDPKREIDPAFREVLSRPFFFLKKGQQCFAFVSEDGKYVIKFLRKEKLEPTFFETVFSFNRYQKIAEEKQAKKQADFSSYDLAYQELKEETGLLLWQHEATLASSIPLTLYDNIGIRHTLPLEAKAFLLQKKSDDFSSYFSKSLAEGKEEALRPFFLQLAHDLRKRVRKRIFDSDLTIEYNLGICEGKPLPFDIGNLRSGSDASPEKQAFFILKTLEEKAPGLAKFFRNALRDDSGETTDDSLNDSLDGNRK